MFARYLLTALFWIGKATLVLLWISCFATLILGLIPLGTFQDDSTNRDLQDVLMLFHERQFKWSFLLYFLIFLVTSFSLFSMYAYFFHLQGRKVMITFQNASLPLNRFLEICRMYGNSFARSLWKIAYWIDATKSPMNPILWGFLGVLLYFFLVNFFCRAS